MKVSRYVKKVQIDEQNSMLYSTLSRQYYIYRNEEDREIKRFLEKINKGEYSHAEVELFRELLNKNIILKDEIDEWKKLEFLENAARYQEKTYKMIIYATNACNFRCTYCEQPHVAKKLSYEAEERILKLIEQQAKKVSELEVDWFGGEPLLEYEKISGMMRKMNKICEKEKCQFIATITTNGYLLDPKRISELKELNVKCMQITVDGNKEKHDRQRILANGKGTFEEIIDNIVEAAKAGITITLRMNIDEENINKVSETLDAIPKELRSNIAISVCNVFQNKEILSTFSILKEAIEKGYIYAERKNRYTHCHACLKSAVVIDTDGAVLLCSFIGNFSKRQK